MLVNESKCTGCGFCMRDCPVSAITVRGKKARIHPDLCTQCRVCFKVCPEQAITPDGPVPRDAVECQHCPIKCMVPESSMGACLRYCNDKGVLVRTTDLHTYEDVKEIAGQGPDPVITRPVITALGAGTTYPCCEPAPHIVTETRGDVDVVTVVTEVPLSYSSVILKIDTDETIGREGDRVFAGKRAVGMVETEQYGSKMLHIGGVNRLTGENGFLVARMITDIANGKEVKLKVENGARLKVRVGQPPEINGKIAQKMRIGCGSATLGIFAPLFKDAADEVIVLDSHVTGLLSRHVAGAHVGVKPTGVELVFRQSTPGRYFGDHGQGWGGTSIVDPKTIVQSVDMGVAWAGMTLLVTETTGQNGAMFEAGPKGELKEIPLGDKAAKVLASIRESCEPSMVSGIYTGGSGGSARAGVTKYPIKLTRAVHEDKAHLTVCGSPGFVLPGGGISFMVDVGKVKPGSFYWTPTPATICPLEYTMKKKDYIAMGGHKEAMKPFKAKE
ncbi:indolepyruvate ferredoxin oxidoreductase subunit alpha [Desulfospira joergensenii]|uniref:indolepyruvate ferredoxin oxidoreductase subunit alpha n=1 Tax=Desulfospira joergensenii TaxID=53329 RepID=UPI0003B38172|nr:4Fe-4S binding protein [Desulfospira joergensenii]